MSKALKLYEEEPWYSEGLSFQCTECGQCCTGSPGYVWINEEEIALLAKHFKITTEKFIHTYVRQVDKRFSLKEHSENYDCIFLKDNKCSVYQLRPIQCRTFPWWPRHLKSKKDWEEAANYCEGINKNAPTVPYETIKEQLVIQEKSRQVNSTQ